MIFSPKWKISSNPDEGYFVEDKYTDRGKWMDGWESRRRRFREDGTCVDGFDHDWCVIRLGVPGIIFGVNADTHHFGQCSAGGVPGSLLQSLEPGPQTHWREILLKPCAAGHGKSAGHRSFTA